MFAFKRLKLIKFHMILMCQIIEKLLILYDIRIILYQTIFLRSFFL